MEFLIFLLVPVVLYLVGCLIVWERPFLDFENLFFHFFIGAIGCGVFVCLYLLFNF